MSLGVFANADRTRLMKQYYREFSVANNEFGAAGSKGEKLIAYTHMVHAVGALTAIMDSLEPEDRERYTDDYAGDEEYNKTRLGRQYLMMIRQMNDEIHKARAKIMK